MRLLLIFCVFLFSCRGARYYRTTELKSIVVLDTKTKGIKFIVLPNEHIPYEKVDTLKLLIVKYNYGSRVRPIKTKKRKFKLHKYKPINKR